MAKFPSSLGLLTLFLSSHAASAAMTLNFQQHDPGFGDDFYPDARCNLPEYGPDRNCGGFGSSDNTTPFLQELYTDPDTGLRMYHIIVGRPADGFAQEVYIRANGPAWEGGAGSASLGDGLCRSGSSWTTDCNTFDPLGTTHDNAFAGIASGDPSTVIMRQLQGGTWNGGTLTWNCAATDGFCQEFLKDTLAQKPKLDLVVRDAAVGMSSTFSFDMRNSDYLTDTTPGAVQSTVTLGSGAAGAAGDFDFAQDAKPADSTITGGLYKFTGSGPTNASVNPYQYHDGNFILDQEWWRYKNP